MKKLSLILPVMLTGVAAIIGTASSCSPIDGRRVVEDYTKCISYVYDHMTGTGFVDVGSSYMVTSDITTSTFGVECNNVQFFDGAPVLSAKVTGMYQYVNADSAYVFMLQRLTSYSSGEFEIDSLRYGRIGAMWLTYFANQRYEVNVVPTNYIMETDTVMVYNTEPGKEGWYRSYYDTNLHTRYNVEIDPYTMTMQLTVNGQKFMSGADGGMPNQYVLCDIPIRFNVEGYTVNASEIKATDKRGNPLPQFNAYDMTGTFTMSFEGKKYLEFKLRNQTDKYGNPVDQRVCIWFYNYNMAQIN